VEEEGVVFQSAQGHWVKEKEINVDVTHPPILLRGKRQMKHSAKSKETAGGGRGGEFAEVAVCEVKKKREGVPNPRTFCCGHGKNTGCWSRKKKKQGEGEATKKKVDTRVYQEKGKG